MMDLINGESFDDARKLPVKTTLVEKGGAPRIYVGVSSETVSVSMSGRFGFTELSTDEAIKLFAGLLEDIKNAGGVE